MGIPEGEESKKGLENLSAEIMTENFPHGLGGGKGRKGIQL